jgi:hypothetical protein
MKIVTVICHPTSTGPLMYTSASNMEKDIVSAGSTASGRSYSSFTLQDTALPNGSVTLAASPANTLRITTLRGQTLDSRWAEDDEGTFFDPCQNRRGLKVALRNQVSEQREGAGVQATKDICGNNEDIHIVVPSQDFSSQGKRTVLVNTTSSDDSAGMQTTTSSLSFLFLFPFQSYFQSFAIRFHLDNIYSLTHHSDRHPPFCHRYLPPLYVNLDIGSLSIFFKLACGVFQHSSVE